MSNAEKIAEWREANPEKQLTHSALLEILDRAKLRGADLSDANLSYAKLHGADLSGADLRNADLRGAKLHGADLSYANLSYANLSYANLRYAYLSDANLWGADLRSAYWQGLQVIGLPSGQITLTPTPDGWVLKVGCWNGTPESLAELIASDDGWPEAIGDEIERRRPGLQAVLNLIEAHTALYPTLIDELEERWAEK